MDSATNREGHNVNDFRANLEAEAEARHREHMARREAEYRADMAERQRIAEEGQREMMARLDRMGGN